MRIERFGCKKSSIYLLTRCREIYTFLLTCLSVPLQSPQTERMRAFCLASGCAMFDFSFKADIKKLERTLDDIAYKQLPFATSQAFTAMAKEVAQAQSKNISAVLDKPTPFTVKSVGYKGATKDSQEAIIYLKDIAADYLEPYEFGGVNKLNGKALLKPVNLGVNQYGNLPRTKLAQLKARKNIFIGKIKTKSGEINGVWQRTPAQRGKPAGIKLLIRFEDAHEVKQNLGWRALAAKIIRSSYNRELGIALAKAIATAK
jgi:hypothetical protein